MKGIDALFVGPADLQYDLQVHHSARTYEDCLKRVAKAAAEHNKASGIRVSQLADIPKMKALGFSWLAISSDLSLLREGFQQSIQAAQQ